MLAIRLAVVALALAACGDDGGKPKDAPGPDAFVCSTKNFTGEIVDWDSTETKFCGVFNAALAVRTNNGDTDMSNPNGRFELCVPPGNGALVDVVQATTASQCSSMPGTYTIGGMLFAEQAVIDLHAMFSARAITMEKLGPFFKTQVGQDFNPAKGQVFVHIEDTQHPVAISSAHAKTMAWDGAKWAAGDTGINVFFPNVDVGSGTTTISVTGNATGAGSYPVVANQFTWVTIVGN